MPRFSCIMPLFFLFASYSAWATTITLNFDSFTDSTVLSTQLPGVIFTNTVVLTAGISLNEFEFPPHSGSNVVSDNGGPIVITFLAPVQSVSGYFTYGEPLTFSAFGSSDQLLGSTASQFSDNEALSGAPGSAPNEYLSIGSTMGISSVSIEGDPDGGSFVLDDLTYGSGAATPEPQGFTIMGLLAVSILIPLKRHRRRTSL